MKKIHLYFSLIILMLIMISSLNSADKIVRIDVLYFHATTRCQACLTIEEFTLNSVNTLFEKELKNSTITFSSIDFLEDSNSHYQNDYQFDTQTLIISKIVDGKEVKWKNLDLIWDYSSDFEKFQKYIEVEINKLLLES